MMATFPCRYTCTEMSFVESKFGRKMFSRAPITSIAITNKTTTGVKYTGLVCRKFYGSMRKGQKASRIDMGRNTYNTHVEC